MIVDKVNAYLSAKRGTVPQWLVDDFKGMAGYAFERQFGPEEEKTASVRLSSIGRCLRQQAYTALGFEENGKEIDSRARMVFFMGDLTEMAVVGLAKAAGCEIRDTGMLQAEVKLRGIVGHPDGLLIDSGTKYLLEIKSMSSFSFKDFEKGVLDEGYRFQCNAYMEGLGLDKCVIVALNKDAGVLAEMLISKDSAIVEDIYRRIDVLKAADKATLPERPYAPDEKGWLPWNCLYCGHWKTCWPDAQKILVSGRYKLALQPKKETTKLTTTTKEN